LKANSEEWVSFDMSSYPIFISLYKYKRCVCIYTSCRIWNQNRYYCCISCISKLLPTLSPCSQALICVVSLHCWWKKSCTTWDVKNPVNTGINYQAQLVSRISEPSTVVFHHLWVSLDCFFAPQLVDRQLDQFLFSNVCDPQGFSFEYPTGCLIGFYKMPLWRAETETCGWKKTPQNCWTSSQIASWDVFVFVMNQLLKC